MITATVSITTTSTSLFDLISAINVSKINNPDGRVAEIQVHWLSGTFYLFHTPGPVNGAGGPAVATDAGYKFVNTGTPDLTGETLLILRHGGINGLSLRDTYLGTDTAGTAMVLAYSV